MTLVLCNKQGVARNTTGGRLHGQTAAAAAAAVIELSVACITCSCCISPLHETLQWPINRMSHRNWHKPTV